MIDRPWPGAPTTPSMSMAIKVNMWICIFGQSQQPTALGRPTPSTRDHSVGRSVGRSVGLSLAGLHRACLSAVQQFGHRCTPFTSLKTCCHFNLKPKHRLGGITKKKKHTRTHSFELPAAARWLPQIVALKMKLHTLIYINGDGPYGDTCSSSRISFAYRGPQVWSAPSVNVWLRSRK